MPPRPLIHRRCFHSTRPSALAAQPASSSSSKKEKTRYNYNTSLSWEEEPDPDHARYRRVTAKDLRGRKEVDGVRRVKMLVRDWVDDGLYNAVASQSNRARIIFWTAIQPSKIESQCLLDLRERHRVDGAVTFIECLIPTVDSMGMQGSVG
ncbi:hypothetical protein QFC21_004600 [Naganishia friedmannii]|uniref:Uncharacterized protein n=1 Tax=Naganishia friedmannii TaxID=89922 RepID=A0ACC2VGR7_9TREE|nr:hypothetical protein QFC21_004600 [Naganishia friedmannii]